MLLITLFCLVPTVLSLTISISSTVVIGEDTPLTWSRTRSETSQDGFELYIGDPSGYDLKSVPASGRSGQTSVVFGSSWTPGPYNIIATWWDGDRTVASAQIQLVAASPTTITQISTGVTTVTQVSTQKLSTNSSDTHAQTPPTTTSKSTTTSASTSVNTTEHSGSSTTSAATAGQSETSGPPSTTNTSPDSSQTAAPNLTGAEVSQSKLPVILGAVLGAVILLLLIGFLIFWCKRHRRQIAASQIDPFTNVEGARSVAPASLINVSTEPSNENNADIETRSIGSLIQVEHSSTVALISPPVSQAPFINPASQTVPSEAARPTSLVKLGEKDLIDLDSHSPLESLVMDPALNHSAALAEIGRLRAELQRLVSRESGVVTRTSGVTDIPPPSYDNSRSERSLTSPV